jgi:hypothetical protein
VAAVSSSRRRRSRRFRRRRPLPALLLLTLLGAVTAMVWTTVLGRVSPAEAACPAPAVPGYSGEVLAPTALDDVAPAPPRLASIRVLNGSGVRGAASIVHGRLAELGFAAAGEPSNDPLHPDFGLDCPGQIRFGTRGEAAARTLSLLLPCAELVRDARSDDSVDLALGTEFTSLRLTAQARSVLRSLAQLGQPAPPPDGQRGGQVGEQVQPAIDPQLLAARDLRCW